jgi:hypothetical protein
MRCDMTGLRLATERNQEIVEQADGSDAKRP